MATKTAATPLFRQNAIDRVLGYFAPGRALSRLRSRAVLNAMDSSGFTAPSSARRSMRGWNVSANSADTDTLPKLTELRAASRDLAMNSPVAAGALERYRTNGIGYGLTLQSQVDRDVLGLSPEEAERWQQETEREFKLLAESKDMDAARTLDFYRMQSLAFVSSLESGEVFVLLPHIPRPNMPYDLRVRILESDMVCQPYGIPDTRKIRSGIETDDNGAPVTYHIAGKHPGDMYGFSTSDNTWTPVPAYGAVSGKRNVLHIFDQRRPGQRRGVPIFAPVIEQLKQLTRLSDAELMAAVIASFFTVFIKRVGAGDSMGLGETYAPDQQVVNATHRADDAYLKQLGSGSMVELDDGEDISVAESKRPNAAFDPFFVSIVKQIGCAINLPFEVLMLHFTASYSASRAAIEQAWRTFICRRVNFSRDFCQPIYEEFLTEAVLRGRIKAPGFFLDPAIRKAWCGSLWQGPGKGQIDTLKETKAAVMKINANLSTHSKEAAAIDGDDWDRVVDRRSFEEHKLRKLGLLKKNIDSDDTADTLEDLAQLAE